MKSYSIPNWNLGVTVFIIALIGGAFLHSIFVPLLGFALMWFTFPDSKTLDEVKKKRQKYFFIVTFLITLLFIGTFHESSQPTQVQNNPAPTVTSEKTPTLHSGDTGYLRTKAKAVLVSATKEDLDQIVKASTINDTEGIMKTILLGKAFFVEQGTKVRILDSTMFSKQVRILDGDMYSKSGWVPMEFISIQ